MADNERPTLPSYNSRGEQQQPPYGDPFADRPRQTHFDEPEQPPYQSSTSLPRPFESTSTLPQEFGSRNQYDEDDEFMEKQPLTSGEDFRGGFYPPGYAIYCSMFTSKFSQYVL